MVKKACFFLCFILLSLLARAQCTGSLGTPIVNETFGSGASLNGPPLAPGITNMQYLVSECPNDGQYAIVNYTSGCYNAWNTVTDHTGDKNGYFMLINASYQPSDFFVQTVNGLCDGTTYEFAAWILNMFAASGGINPNITFTIEKTDGAVLKSYSTGDITFFNPAKWGRYGFFFTTPVGVSTVVLRMHNNAPGGGGNDLGLDDITFSPSGPEIDLATNGVNGDVAHVLCSKTNISAKVATCYIKNAYQWQTSADGANWTDLPGETRLNLTVNLPAIGSYYYRLNVAQDGNMQNATCRSHSNTLNVIYDLPTASNISAAICPGSKYMLPSGRTVSAAGTFRDTVRNKGGCDSLITLLDLSIKPKAYSTLTAAICEGDNYLGYTKTGTYTDILTAANGCDSIRTLNLTVKKKAYTTLSTAICRGDTYHGHNKSGIYTDTLTAANGCDSLVTTTLTVAPDFDLGPDKILCFSDSIILRPGLFKSYLWQDGSTTPFYTVKTGGVYWVKVTDENGCTGADTVAIKEINCSLTKIPNAFTPNGDGINDTWNIDVLQIYPQCTVFIYTRWGQLVFKSDGYTKPWDGRNNGKDLPAGTYYYMIDLKDGSPRVSGYVTVIR